MITRSKSKGANHERWLVSYADFITLLFAFFVVLYASAQVDRHRVAALSSAIQTGFEELGAFSAGPVPGSASPKISSAIQPRPMATQKSEDDSIFDVETQLRQALADELGRKEVSIRNTPEGLVLSLREIGFFESGSAELKPQSQVAFAKLADVLRRWPHRIRIEGHTDNLPIHNARFNSNWELSTARATEVVRLLVTEFEFPPARLSAAGYGEFHPVADNAFEEGRAANRRVDVVILTEHKQL